MRRWSVFVVLAVIVLGLLAAGELLQESGQGGAEPKTPRLATHTPTATRTPGWWAEVATWTPTPTGEGTQTPEEKPAERSTPTPELNLPPVKTMVPPTKDGGQP